MKRILGLDLGTNSIGWALIEVDYEYKKENCLGGGEIVGLGSRIIPMNEALLSEFGKGNTVSQTADRTDKRGVRRLRQRHLLRRERLHRVLNILDFLPQHYAKAIDFEKRLGQFFENEEPKIPYHKNEDGQYEFLFMESFLEMVEDFKENQPALFYKKENGEETKIPYDWTIYYLRKKALTEKISKEELAWLILHFNQKRGYYQQRGDEIDKAKDDSKRVEFIETLVTDVIDTGELQGKDQKKYKIILENGLSFIKPSKNKVEWKGKRREFIVTTELNDDGSEKLTKDKDVKRSFKSVDSEKDWIAVKSKSEKTINESGKTVGCYIYDTLLQKPNQKIRGRLVRTIERDFYKSEFKSILSKQVDLQPELFATELYEKCVKHLYPNNIPHQTDRLKKGFVHLFTEDILFYQRPLKTKKSLIAECKYEFREYVDKHTGEKKKQWLKCIAKSHPLYQEFRLWEFVQNLKIYEREGRMDGRLQTDVNVSNELITSIEDKVALFEQLNDRKTIKQNILLGFFKKAGKKLTDKTHRWNYVEDKEYPCNETRAGFITILKKNKEVDWKELLTQDAEVQLWHTLYSISEKNELKSALKKLAVRLKANYSALEPFNDFPPFKKEYGAFSYKALNKLLPLLRLGNHWCETQIPDKVKDRTEKIINAEDDDSIQILARQKAYDRNLDAIDKFQGLPLWLASYIVYGRHSEVGEKVFWKKPSDIERLKQHSLRNPIVEQVINETLQVIKDIWLHYGNGDENFFDEIHIELGRDMKNPADKRKRLTNQITENQNTNLRIRAILKELMNDQDIEGDIKDYSPSQQDILKIYEEGVLTSTEKLPDEIEKISRKAEPTQKEIQKYRLWMDQKYVSPYTSEMIPMSKLFTSAYEIEHILPQSRYFDDSLNNKVICEAEVNSLKGNQTGYEFIEKHGGEKKGHGEMVSCYGNKKVRVLSKPEYEQHIQNNFNGRKKDILLMPNIPESFTNRQMTDSRYISKVVMKLMSNLVREENEEEATSKHVVPVTGKVTARLKRDWGLNDVWNDLIAPRFQRMNKLSGTNDFGYWDAKGGNKFFRNEVSHELRKDFDPKRIDHRHHSLDALIIALADRRHVNYLNNQNAAASKKEERFDLRRKLRRLEEKQITDKKTGERKTIQVAKEFLKPWKNITKEVKDKLATTVVSVKQNKRVINKNVNRYEKWKLEDSEPKKFFEKQNKNEEWWSVRRPLHLETVYGKVTLRKRKEVSFNEAIKEWENIIDKGLRSVVKNHIKNGLITADIIKQFKKEPYTINGKKVEKVEVCYFDDNVSATRKSLDTSFDEKTIINSITDTGIQKILLNHLRSEKYHGQTEETGKLIPAHELAFSPEGLEDLNKNIKHLNDGKSHQPIYKVRKYEALGKKFPVGEKGNKQSKFVVAATGTNLFFAIYEGKNEKGETVRQFNTIPLNEVILQLKDGINPVPEKFIDKKGNEYPLLFSLSPNDVVYLPSQEEKDSPSLVDFSNLTQEQQEKVYLFIDGSGTTANFIPCNSAKVIFNMNKKDQTKAGIQYSIQNEYGVGSPQSKNQKSLNGDMIKEICWKLETDRLGNLKHAKS